MLGGFNRKNAAKAAAEISEHLSIIENIRALQEAQKEMSENIRQTNDRVLELYAEMRALRAELKYECLKETQAAINGVQGSLNARMESLSNRLAVLDSTIDSSRDGKSGRDHALEREAGEIKKLKES